MIIHFAYPFALVLMIPIIMGAMWYRIRYYKPTTYRYALTHQLKKKLGRRTKRNWRKITFFILRTLLLLLLAFLAARPQRSDQKTKLPVDGIDIMLTLDVSGSMSFIDDMKNRQTRIDVAKREAREFVKKREHDAIGLVLFGNDAVCRIPLTMDKKLIAQLIDDIEIGAIDHRGTVLAQGLLLAIKRLESSSAKSNIIILITDGAPSAHDLKPDMAIQLAQKKGIKVYTIAIGNEQKAYGQDMWGRWVPYETSTNKQLLQEIAQKTGGSYFEAAKAEDLKEIYHQIDKLEKNEHDTPLYHYRDVFEPFAWSALILAGIELIISLIWFGV